MNLDSNTSDKRNKDLIKPIKIGVNNKFKLDADKLKVLFNPLSTYKFTEVEVLKAENKKVSALSNSIRKTQTTKINGVIKKDITDNKNTFIIDKNLNKYEFLNEFNELKKLGYIKSYSEFKELHIVNGFLNKKYYNNSVRFLKKKLIQSSEIGKNTKKPVQDKPIIKGMTINQLNRIYEKEAK